MLIELEKPHVRAILKLQWFVWSLRFLSENMRCHMCVRVNLGEMKQMVIAAIEKLLMLIANDFVVGYPVHVHHVFP